MEDAVSRHRLVVTRGPEQEVVPFVERWLPRQGIKWWSSPWNEILRFLQAPAPDTAFSAIPERDMGYNERDFVMDHSNDLSGTLTLLSVLSGFEAR